MVEIAVNRSNSHTDANTLIERTSALAEFKTRISLSGATIGTYLTAGVTIIGMEVVLRYFMNTSTADIESFHINKAPAITVLSALPGFLIGGSLGKRLRFGEIIENLSNRTTSRMTRFFED